MICNQLFKHQKNNGWKFSIPCQICLSSLMSVWWDKKFIENFYNYYILLKSYVNLLPLGLTLKLTQDNVSWRKSFSISPFIRWIKGYLLFLFGLYEKLQLKSNCSELRGSTVGRLKTNGLGICRLSG